MTPSSLAIFLLGLFFLPLGDAAGAPMRPPGRPLGGPLRPCKTCPSKSQLEQPGIGYALDTGYGTAAIRWHNGTLQPVVQIKGSPSYLRLMAELSHTTPGSRFPNDIPTTRGKFQYTFNHLRRFVNKLFGRPANKQTAVLAEMIARLKASVEKTLPHGTQATHAVVTSPDHIRLTAYEIDDILDYLHIRNSMAAPDELFATLAAFAGYGKGLCKVYTDYYTCTREESFVMGFEQVLHLHFSDAALIMTLKGMWSYKRSGADATRLFPELDYRTAESDEEVDELFSKIAESLGRFLSDHKGYSTRLTMILLTGTRVTDKRFKQVLRNTLTDFVPSEAMQEHRLPFLFRSETTLLISSLQMQWVLLKLRNGD